MVHMVLNGAQGGSQLNCGRHNYNTFFANIKSTWVKFCYNQLLHTNKHCVKCSKVNYCLHWSDCKRYNIVPQYACIILYSTIRKAGFQNRKKSYKRAPTQGSCINQIPVRQLHSDLKIEIIIQTPHHERLAFKVVHSVHTARPQKSGVIQAWGFLLEEFWDNLQQRSPPRQRILRTSGRNAQFNRPDEVQSTKIRKNKIYISLQTMKITIF